MMPISVYLIEDERLIGQAMAQMLARISDMTVAGWATTLAQAFVELAACKVDIVIMDVRLRDGNGIDATKKLLADFPGTKVIMLSGYYSPSLLAASISAGASGYLRKATSIATLCEALAFVHASDSFYVEEENKSELHEIIQELRSGRGRYNLTERERAVLQLIAQECSTREIAAQLAISEKTVRNHKSNIMQKLNVCNDAGIIKHAYYLALI